MKRLGIALILTCILSVSALAGDVPTVGAPSVPTQPPGDISTPGVSSSAPSAGTQSIGTTILLTVLSLIR